MPPVVLIPRQTCEGLHKMRRQKRTMSVEGQVTEPRLCIRVASSQFTCDITVLATVSQRPAAVVQRFP